MNCENVRTLIGAFIDDELTVEITAQINGHIANCLECDDERATLSMLRSRLQDLREDLEAPPGFMQRLRERVESRRQAGKRSAAYRASSVAAPIAAAAAVLFLTLPHIDRVPGIAHPSGTVGSMSVGAHELFSYENDVQQSRLKPVALDPSLSNQLVGLTPESPAFHGWHLLQTCVVSVNATNAIKYSYGQMDRGRIKTFSCYQFRGGVFDASELSHHVIDGRSICCGTHDSVSLVYWNNKKRDFVLASQMSRAELMSVALDS